jgi:hypothetical protein
MNTETMFARNMAANIANTIYETEECAPTPFTETHWSTGYMDVVSGRSDSIYKLSIIEFLKIYVKSGKLLHINTEHINKPQIRANLYQHKFLINDKPFYCLTLSKVGMANHPLVALADSIMALGVESGCERCGYSEDGCEGCGFNKARSVLMKIDGIEPFAKTADVFFDAIGEGRTAALLDLSSVLREKMKSMFGKADELKEKIEKSMQADITDIVDDSDNDMEEEDDDDFQNDWDEERPNLKYQIDEDELMGELFSEEDLEDDEENDD